MQSSWIIGILALAACGPSADGTVWYQDRESSVLTQLELASGETVTVDNRGPYHALATDPQSRRIAYAAGPTVFVAVQGAEPIELDLTSGDVSAWPRWHHGDWLTYSTRSGDRSDVALVRPGTQSRMLGAVYLPAFTDSGDRIAYLASDDTTRTDPHGDLVIESPDGSDRIVLAFDVSLVGIAFTPDASAVLATDSQNNLLRYPITGGPAVSLGTGFVLRHFVDSALSASPDSSKVLVEDSQGVWAVSLLDGQRERVVSDPTGAFGNDGAMFIDDATILYSHTTYDSDVASSTSLHVVRDTQDTLLLQQDNALSCAAVAAHLNERVAILCVDNVYLVDIRTATIEATVPAVAVLGFSADGQDLYIESSEGDVMRLSIEGDASVVAHAAVGQPAAYLP